MVDPLSSFMRTKQSSSIREALESRAPVGSSARISLVPPQWHGPKPSSVSPRRRSDKDIWKESRKSPAFPPLPSPVSQSLPAKHAGWIKPGQYFRRLSEYPADGNPENKTSQKPDDDRGRGMGRITFYYLSVL